MAEILDIIDEKKDPKEALQSIRDNFLTINKQSLRAGAYLLTALEVKTNQTVSSLTYVALSQFAGSVNTSGGLVQFCGSIITNNSPANTCIGLFVDDVEVAQSLLVGDIATNVSVSYIANLNAGNHKWQLKAKTNAGSTEIGYYAALLASSKLYITENLRG